MTTKSLVRRSNTQSVLRQFLKNLRRDKLAMVGVILLVFFIVVAIFATSLAPHGARDRHYNENRKIRRLEPPSLAHPFGTTDVGRDIFSQVILGTRTALTVGLLAAILVTALGSVVGIVAGYYGGATDVIIMRIVDFFYAIPLSFVIVLPPSPAQHVEHHPGGVHAVLADWPAWSGPRCCPSPSAPISRPGAWGGTTCC